MVTSAISSLLEAKNTITVMTHMPREVGTNRQPDFASSFAIGIVKTIIHTFSCAQLQSACVTERRHNSCCKS